jgi:HK97 family phage major capsid protein
MSIGGEIMDRLTELRQALGRAVDKLNTPAVLADHAQFEAVELEVTNLEAEIGRAERALQRAAGLARPVGGQSFEADAADGEGAGNERTLSSLVAEARAYGRMQARVDRAPRSQLLYRPQQALPELRRAAAVDLQALRQQGHQTDSRLVRAPTGAGEVDPTGGGFLVQTDFMRPIFMLAHDMGEILSRVNTIPISAVSNGLKIPGVDESSRATGSRWGGVSSNWAAEGTCRVESKPKFRMVEFDLKKLISKMTVTDELLRDAPR